MKKQTRFSPEVRERAVRMVHEHRAEYPSVWLTVESIAPKIGCTPSTLLEWFKRAKVDSGNRAGVTTDERERIAPRPVSSFIHPAGRPINTSSIKGVATTG